jgi:hypothetical protein
MQTVSLLQTASDPPILGFASLVSLQEKQIVIDLPKDGPVFPEGTQLILDFAKGSNEPRRIVSVSKVQGQQLTLEVRMKHTDLREYPRMYAGIQLEYTAIPGDDSAVAEDIERWNKGEAVSRSFRSPDPFMNFSATGLQFEDIKACNDNDTLLVLIQIPKQDISWRALARVVRVSEIPEDQRDEYSEATHRVAVHFVQLSEEARVALREHTLKIQRAFLGDPDENQS